jgi:hypothetical protein
MLSGSRFDWQTDWQSQAVRHLEDGGVGMPKRAKGEGAVYLRGDGRWEAQLRLGVGRRKSVYGRTRREVLGKLREARWSLKRGLPVSSRKRHSPPSWSAGWRWSKGGSGPAPMRAMSSTPAVSAELGEVPL